MPQNESAIEQINLSFNDQEDRLLLKLGLADKTEIAVWITRRLCKAMWNLLQTSNANALQASLPSTASANKKQAMENFALEIVEQKKIVQMDFRSDYTADRQARSQEPMLATLCVIIPNENSPPHLEFRCTNGQAVQMVLSYELVYAVTNMMQLATREAGWDLQMTSNSTQINMNADQQVLH